MQIYCLTFIHPTNFQTHCWKLIRHKSKTLPLLNCRHSLDIHRRASPGLKQEWRIQNQGGEREHWGHHTWFSKVQVAPRQAWTDAQWGQKKSLLSLLSPASRAWMPIQFHRRPFTTVYSNKSRWLDYTNIISLDTTGERGAGLRESLFSKSWWKRF